SLLALRRWRTSVMASPNDSNESVGSTALSFDAGDACLAYRVAHCRLLCRRSLRKLGDVPPSAQPFHPGECSRHRPPILLPSFSCVRPTPPHRRVSSQQSCPAVKLDWRNRQLPGRSQPINLASSPLPLLDLTTAHAIALAASQCSPRSAASHLWRAAWPPISA